MKDFGKPGLKKIISSPKIPQMNLIIFYINLYKRGEKTGKDLFENLDRLVLREKHRDFMQYLEPFKSHSIQD